MRAGEPRRRDRALLGAATSAAPSWFAGVRHLVRCALLAAASFGCATGWVHEGGRLVDERKGLSIGAPPGGDWQRVEVDGSVLTLRRSDGVTLSWLRSCGDVADGPRAASQDLLRNVGRLQIVEEGPLEMARGEAWKVVAELGSAGSSGQLQAVTRVADDCTDDWVLAASGDAEVGNLLHDWWSSVDAPQVAAEGATLP